MYRDPILGNTMTKDPMNNKYIAVVNESLPFTTAMINEYDATEVYVNLHIFVDDERIQLLSMLQTKDALVAFDPDGDEPFGLITEILDALNDGRFISQRPEVIQESLSNVILQSQQLRLKHVGLK